MENYYTNVPYHLILGELEQKLSTLEAKELEHWKNLSGENMFIYNSLQNIDEQLDLLRLYQKTDSVAAWNRNKAILLPSRGRNSTFMWAAAVAAAVILVISVIVFNRSASETYETAANETRQITLPDSSEIYLNQHSAISFRRSGFDQKRHIRLLRGEALFQVKHDVKREFTVESGDLLVRDIGTTFDLKIDSGSIRAIVSSGSVSMEYNQSGTIRDNRKVVLEADQMGIFNRHTKKINTATTIPDNYKAWQDRKLRYNQTPLDIVIADLKALYGTEVRLADSSLKDKKLTALLTNKSGEQNLQIIAATLQLKLEIVKKDSIFMLSQ